MTSVGVVCKDFCTVHSWEPSTGLMHISSPTDNNVPPRPGLFLQQILVLLQDIHCYNLFLLLDSHLQKLTQADLCLPLRLFVEIRYLRELVVM